MGWALAVLVTGLSCTGCGIIDRLSSNYAHCYRTGSRISDGPFAVAIKPFPDPLVPMLNTHRPANGKAGSAETTVALANTSAGVVTVEADVSGYLIDDHGDVVSARPDGEPAAAGYALVPLEPGHSHTFPVSMDVERCGTRYGRGLPAGRYRMRVQISYTVGGVGAVKTIDSTTTVPVVLR